MTIADRVQFQVQSAFWCVRYARVHTPFLSRLAEFGDYAGQATERGFVLDREIGATKQ
jgi:hypothetical protein